MKLVWEQVYNNRMKKLRILIVDDAPYIRDVLRVILTKYGHEIVGEAQDGEQAVAMALQHHPDLVIMDIVMPLKSGLQATKEILDQLPATKVVACSTADQDTMVMKAMEAGAVDFINKPFHVADVLNIIEKIFYNAGSEK